MKKLITLMLILELLAPASRPQCIARGGMNFPNAVATENSQAGWAAWKGYFLRPLSSADRQETLYSLQIPGANATVIVKQGVYSDTREPHFQKEAIPIILKGVSEILRRVLIVSNWQQKMPGCPVRLEISKDLELFVISGGGGERFLDDGTAYIGTDIGMMRDPRLFRSIPGLEPRFYSSNEFDHYLNAERILTVPS